MSATEIDRRSGIDRRSTTLAAYWHGARYPRRRGGRRATDQPYAIVDWYPPRLLIPAFAVLCLCVLDGVLTIMLMNHGAAELNPVMALFLPHNLLGFALAKLALTGPALCVLVACSRMQLFRRIHGEAIVYVVLGLYVWLVAYELQMLELATGLLT